MSDNERKPIVIDRITRNLFISPFFKRYNDVLRALFVFVRFFPVMLNPFFSVELSTLRAREYV